MNTNNGKNVKQWAGVVKRLSGICRREIENKNKMKYLWILISGNCETAKAKLN